MPEVTYQTTRKETLTIILKDEEVQWLRAIVNSGHEFTWDLEEKGKLPDNIDWDSIQGNIFMEIYNAMSGEE